MKILWKIIAEQFDSMQQIQKIEIYHAYSKLKTVIETCV